MPKTVFASGVGRCFEDRHGRFRALDRLACHFQVGLFSSRGRQLDLDVMGLALVVAELVRFLLHRVLRRRDEHQDAIAFVAAIGDFDLLLLRAFEHGLEFLADGDRRIRRALDVHRRGSMPVRARPVEHGILRPRANDHHEDDQNADEVGDDVEERVLPGSVDFTANARVTCRSFVPPSRCRPTARAALRSVARLRASHGR